MGKKIQVPEKTHTEFFSLIYWWVWYTFTLIPNWGLKSSQRWLQWLWVYLSDKRNNNFCRTELVICLSYLTYPLCDTFQNTEFFLVRIWTLFTQWSLTLNLKNYSYFIKFTDQKIMGIFRFFTQVVSVTRKKCPYSKFLWSLFSWIQTDYGDLLCKSPYISVFSPNVEKYGTEKLRIRTRFLQWVALANWYINDMFLHFSATCWLK